MNGGGAGCCRDFCVTRWRVPLSHLHAVGHQEPAGQEEVRGHQDRCCCGTRPPGKREMPWPQMSTGDLAGDFG